MIRVGYTFRLFERRGRMMSRTEIGNPGCRGKRLRSSSTAMTQVGRPQQVGEYPPLASHNRYDARESVLTHSLPHIVPHATEGPGGLLPLQYRRSSYTHLHSTSNRHPELTHAMYPLENGLLPTNASLAGKSSLPRDRSKQRHPVTMARVSCCCSVATRRNLP
jgi:hypothetical protein